MGAGLVTVALPLMTAGALAVTCLVAGLRFPSIHRAAAWFALAALGQGAALSMVIAGTPIRYQHYAPFATMIREHPLAVAILVVQAVIVAAGCVAAVRRGTFVGMPRGRVALALALSTVTAATVSPAISRYVSELALAAAIQVIAIANITLAALSWPLASTTGEPEDAVEDSPQVEWQTWIAAAGAFVVAAVLTVTAYERHPHIPDEVAYLHHAKYLAEGLIAMPAPPVDAAFDVDLMEYEATRWYSPMPLGWPLVLAVGVRAGVPWFVNPLLAGLNVVLTRLLLGHLYSRRVARRGAVLLAASPWFLFLGMSLMPHQVTLCFTLLAALGVTQARRTASWRWGVVAGVSVGIVSLIRPLDGVVVGGLIAAWAIGIGGSRLRLGPLAGLAAGTLAAGALVFPYNRALTGDGLTFPVNAYFNKHYAPNVNAYGFGPDRGLGWATDPNPGHSPIDGIINANLNTFSINTDLFGWVTGSLILVAWLLCSGRWRRTDALLMAVVAGFVLAYFPYYFSGGPDYGARYWFPVIVPFAALTARGIEALPGVYRDRGLAAVTALSLLALVIYVPWRAADKYYHFRGMRADLRALAAARDFGASDLVLVKGRRMPDYASAFALNPVDLRGPAPVYAWDRDPETRAAVLRAYRDRRVWFVDGPSETGEGFRVASGPVPASTLLGDSR